MSAIRQIGDLTLHRQASPVIHFSGDGSHELNRQIELMKKTLYATGGVGIAANQCAQIDSPLKIILVGVDYQNTEHAEKAALRYPGILFPQMQIYINPEVIQFAEQEDIFPEGCLSVQGPLRAIVKRSSSVTVKYQDTNGHFHEHFFTGNDARVMLHELDHINHGMVYIQHIIKELTHSQIEKLKKLIGEALLDTSDDNKLNPFATPLIGFNRDEKGDVIFDEDKIKEALHMTSAQALRGIIDNLKSSPSL